MERLNITVIGGSASTNFGNPEIINSWSILLNKELGNHHKFTIISKGGLTFLDGMQILSEISPCDLIILHFGTSVGWPVSLVGKGPKFGIDFSSAYGFHQPPHVSRFRAKRIKGFLKRRLRNTIKYFLFFFGLYRPAIKIGEIDEQIQTVINLANQKAPKIIWVQQRALMHHRIFLEKLVYKGFYGQIMTSLARHEDKHFRVIRLSQDFMISRNFLFDRIHLTPTGHEALEALIRREI
jgi:hypothetical protein